MNLSTPKGWRTASLDEFLTEKQIQRVAQIVNENYASSENRIGLLREYLNTIKEEVESKGILADFLAYAIEYHFMGRSES
jgi:hypothetical protein